MQQRGTFGDAWRLYRAHARRVVAISAVVHLVFLALAALLVYEIGTAGLSIALLLWLAGSFWLQAPLAQLVRDARAGVPQPGARATFDRIVPHTAAISVGALFAGIGVGIGFWLFVIPGLFLLTRWSLLVPVIVWEEVGTFRAFARSRDLVRGHGWPVFGTILATAALLFAGLFVVAFLAGIATAFGAPDLLAMVGAAFVVLTLLAPLLGLVWTLRYLGYYAERPPRPAAETSYLAVGDTLDAAWEVYKRHPSRLVALATAPAALVAGALLLPVDAGLGALLTVAVALAGFGWLAALVADGLETFEDTPPRPWLRERLGVAGRRMPALAGLTIVSGLAYLTVLGLLALPLFAVSAAVATAEGADFRAALRRGHALVGTALGRAAKLLALSLLVAALVPLALAIFAPPLGPVGVVALGGLAMLATGPYVALAWALMYRRLQELEAAARVSPSPPAPALSSHAG